MLSRTISIICRFLDPVSSVFWKGVINKHEHPVTYYFILVFSVFTYPIVISCFDCKVLLKIIPFIITIKVIIIYTSFCYSFFIKNKKLRNRFLKFSSAKWGKFFL